MEIFPHTRQLIKQIDNGAEKIKTTNKTSLSTIKYKTTKIGLKETKRNRVLLSGELYV